MNKWYMTKWYMFLHHRNEEVLVTDLVDEFEVLCLPFHVLFLAVNPFLDEFLRRIIIRKSLCEFAHFLYSDGADGYYLFCVCFSCEVKQSFRQMAVAVGMLVQIVLVVFVRRVEVLQRLYLYHER